MSEIIIEEEKVKTYSEEELFSDQKEPKTVPFVYEDPNILLNSQYVFELFPSSGMSTNQKLNAIVRVIILVTIFLFIVSKYSTRILMIGTVTLAAIFLFYFYSSKQSFENFADPVPVVLAQNGISVDPNTFDTPTSKNPFSNVLVTDYEFNPQKKPALPSYPEDVNNEILFQAKKLVNEMNPSQPNLSDKLFKGLGDEMDFEQSLRQFNSNPATTIPNDQRAFAEFCYGSMVSCKEGNLFACAKNATRYTVGQP